MFILVNVSNNFWFCSRLCSNTNTCVIHISNNITCIQCIIFCFWTCYKIISFYVTCYVSGSDFVPSVFCCFKNNCATIAVYFTNNFTFSTRFLSYVYVIITCYRCNCNILKIFVFLIFTCLSCLLLCFFCRLLWN